MGRSAEKTKAKSKAGTGGNQALVSDVASFAASLGLSAGAEAAASGFNDSDFRKKGPLRKPEAEKFASLDEEKKGNKNQKKSGGKDVKRIRPDKKGRPDTERKAGGNKENFVGNAGHKKSLNNTKRENVNGSIDGKSAAWKSKQLDANSKKRKASWESEADGESESKRTLVERPFGEPEFVQKLRSEAQELLEKTTNDFEKNRSRNKDAEWLLKARRSGTSSDKVAAMTVLLQENPKANVRTLDSLLGMVTSKAGKRHAATGIDALKELFLYNLLPDCKLKYFAQQPLSTLPEGKDRAPLLMEWIWEDCLKHRYERFVMALDEASKDKLPFMKEKALKSVYELLKSKPEQERRLLSTLVNKLGDPERKVASNASYLLSCLLTAHPNMKKVVVDEVDAFVFRPQVGLRARYYAAVFLNQIILSVKGDGPKLAKQLIDLYFALFKAVTAGDVGEAMDRDGKKKTKEGKGSRKEKDTGKSGGAGVTTEIDSRLLSALLTGVNRAFPYVSPEDLDTITQENSVLFRLVHSNNFNVAVQALMLLHQLMVKNQAVNDRFYRALYTTLLSDGLAKSSKTEMFLGLIFKALKSDMNPRRMSAFAKRLTQVAMQQSVEFACASLFLISETLKLKPTLWNAILNPEDEGDDVEHFVDHHEGDSDEKEEITESHVEERVDDGITPDPEDSGETWPQKGYYNPKARDPLYCQAHRACWWELSILSKHVHPSVAAMARTLLSGASIVYNGDPLRDLALGVFLDRFVEKKPKAIKGNAEGTWHGSSMALPAKLVGPKPGGPVGEDILKLAEEDVAPEDVVFHKFYSTKSNRTKPRKIKKEKSEDYGLGLDEAVDFGDDSDDDELDELLENEAAHGMMLEGDESEGEDDGSDDEGMVYKAKDEDNEDNSEADVEGDRDDEVALLQAGLEISSSDEEELESESEDMFSGEEDFLPKKDKKPKTGQKVTKGHASVFQEAEDLDGEVIGTEDVMPKRRNKQKSKAQPEKKSSSVFQELEDSDFEDASLAVSTSKKGRRNKSAGKRRLSVFQEAGSDSDEEGLLKQPEKLSSAFGDLEDSDFDDTALAVSTSKKGRNKSAGKRRLSVFQEAGSDSDDEGLLKLSAARGRNQFRSKEVSRVSVFKEAGASLSKNHNKKSRKGQKKIGR